MSIELATLFGFGCFVAGAMTVFGLIVWFDAAQGDAE